MSFLENRKIIGIFFVTLFFLFLWLSLSSDWSYGGADDIVHYRFARYSFMYPHLLLDHWAKPLFTLLSSPFAQIGFLGMKLFNLLVGFGSAFLILRVCSKLRIRYGVLAVLFMFSAPVYLSMLISGMTEVLFGFVLLLAIYLVLNKQFAWAAVVLSFILFVRNEGIVFFPFFIIYFLINRKYWQTLLFSTGFWVYSFVGYLYYHDFWWVVTRMPYTGAKDIYGSGPLLHFVTHSNEILGKPITSLFLVGAVLAIINFFRKQTITDSTPSAVLWLLIGPVAAYFSAHSVLWWQGWGGSFGLIRVMAGIAPVAAVVALYGLDCLMKQLISEKVKVASVLILSILVLPLPFKYYKYPVDIGDSQKVIRDAAFWAKEEGLTKQRIYYYDHFLWFVLGLNPFDSNQTWETVPHHSEPSKDVPPGCMVVWDAYFAVQEGRTPLQNLMNDSLMQLVKVFRPHPMFTVMNNHSYEVCLFKRRNEKADIQNNYIEYAKPCQIVNTTDE